MGRYDQARKFYPSICFPHSVLSHYQCIPIIRRTKSRGQPEISSTSTRNSVDKRDKKVSFTLD